MESILYKQEVELTLKNRDFENLRLILIKYLKEQMDKSNQDFSKLPVKYIQITYYKQFHKSKIFSYRNDLELVYKIVNNMFSDVKILLLYDWVFDNDIITNLIDILINNDSFTITKKTIDII